MQPLTLEQKIGQLFIVTCIIDQQKNKALVSHKPYRTDVEYVKKLIQEHYVGGVIYLGKGTIDKQRAVTQELQNLSAIPLCIMQDLEWGLSMRLTNGIHFPKAMTLGALQDNTLIYEMGKEIARQCKILGVHMNLAPIVDINTNPDNPIIHDRSFGNDKENVATKAAMYMHGLHAGGILTCAKHFPGHGDVAIDSHLDLPTIFHELIRLESVELYPFKKIIEQGVDAIMIGHLAVPALEKNSHLPASLSSIIVTQLLQNQLDFKGLIITDALDMAGVLKYHEPGEIELQAFLAGNDILLCSVDIPKAIATLKKAINDGRISMEMFDAKVAKIMRIKEWISKQERSKTDETLVTQHTIALKKALYSNAITIACDIKNLLPLKKDKQKIVQITDAKNILPACKKIAHADDLTILISFATMNRSVKDNFGITQETIQCINNLIATDKKIILVFFGSPYAIKLFNTRATIIVAYENDPDAQEAVARIICGNLKACGKLPV